MFRFRSLSSKLMFIGIVILTFLVIYIYSGFLFTQHMKGLTNAIDLAGQLRFRSFEMAWLTQKIVKADLKTRESSMREIRHEIETFDRIISYFKYGNEELNIEPVIHYEEAQEIFNSLSEEWNNYLKPLLLRLAELRGDDPEEMELFSRYDSRVHRYVYDVVDRFVKSLGDHHERKIKDFDIFRFYVFGFFLLATVIIIFYASKSILKPVQRLRNAVEEIEKGNFDVRVDTKTRDEIGDLGNASNRMAQTLKVLFDEKARHLKEVWALAEASNILFAIPLTEDIYKAICNISIRNFDLKFVWIGLIEEGAYNVKPVAHSGYEEGYLSHIKVTGDDSLTGMVPSSMAIKTKTSWVIHDYESDPAIYPWREEALKRGYRSSMAMPLIFSDDKVIGVLKFYSGEPQFFTERRVDSFQVFANQVTTTIENRWLIEGLEEKVKEKTREIEIARIHAESANKAKSEFLANMSHELRTPLNSVIGFSEIMIDGMAGEMKEEQKGFLKNIHDSGKHLLSLIEDILDLSRIEAGKTELELSRFSLKECFEESLEMFREKSIKHNIKLKVEVKEGIGDIVADKRRIKQIIINLVGNALKFTPDGGSVSVKARIVRSSELGVSGLDSKLETLDSKLDRDFIEISVEDTGIGISPDDQKRLFQPFQQLETTLSKKYPGTGLGLNLSKKLVELHGGWIWVESEVGKGSRFTFVIPMRQNT